MQKYSCNWNVTIQKKVYDWKSKSRVENTDGMLRFKFLTDFFEHKVIRDDDYCYKLNITRVPIMEGVVSFVNYWVGPSTAGFIAKIDNGIKWHVIIDDVFNIINKSKVVPRNDFYDKFTFSKKGDRIYIRKLIENGSWEKI